jgi:hypothetical protein
MLPATNFMRVFESGLGGTKHNFDTISFHTLPNPRPADNLWPDPSPEEQQRQRQEFERVARENPAYEELSDDICGRTELAGQSVSVPFVGVTASTLVLAESLRLLHDGPAYSDIKLSLSDPKNLSAIRRDDYTVHDSVGISFCEISPVRESI